MNATTNLAAMIGPLNDALLDKFKPDLTWLEAAAEQQVRSDPVSKEQLPGALITAAWAAKRFPEVAFIGAASGTHLWSTPRAFGLYLQALHRVHARDMLAGAATFSADNPPPPAIATMAFEARITANMYFGVDDYRRLWGAPGTSLRDALGNMPQLKKPNRQVERLADALIHLRRTPSNEQQPLRDHLLWGARAVTYYRSVILIDKALKLSGKPLTAEGAMISDLAAQAVESFQTPDLTDVLARRDAGHGILIATMHAGPQLHNKAMIEEIGLPDTLLIANQRVDRKAKNGLKISAKVSGHLGFLSAVKAVRKEPRLIRLFPDGPMGERVERQVLGVPVKLGVGAAVLGWRGNAATYVLRCEWQDMRPVLTLVPGPVADKSADKERFETTFLDAYAAQIEHIATGPAENIGGRGGVWGTLAAHAPT